jgi:uncharacterized repeat protein (TIGR03803 family)
MQTLKLLLAAVASLVLASVFAGRSSAQNVTTLFNFTSATGQEPDIVLLAQGQDGALYGTTRFGGVHGDGTVFRQEPDGTNTTIFNFSSANGIGPAGGVILASDGNFYGTTGGGGRFKQGVLFRITQAGVYTVLYSFGVGDGIQPTSPPIEGADGNLYGTTNGNSKVYKYDMATGKVTKIYTATTHGFSFFASPLQTTEGSLYVTANLGALGVGSVIKLSPSGKYLNSYSFTGGTGGAYPIGPVIQATDGNIYGTTWIGGTYNLGTIYKVTPVGIQTVYSFGTVSNDATFIDAGLTQGSDGNLYGVSTLGGVYGAGALFQLTLDGSYTKLYDFPVPSGFAYQNALAAPAPHTNGLFYGVTTDGGSKSLGQVYQLSQGLGPFVAFVQAQGKVDVQTEILGHGFTGTTSVTFNGVPAGFSVVSDTYLTARVPSGATTGPVVVTTPGGVLNSNKNFVVSK